MAHSFPTLIRLNINLVQKVVGLEKTVVQMVNRLRKTQPTLPCHEYTCNLCFILLGWGKNGPAQFSPPPRKQRLFAYSRQGKVDTFTCLGGKVTDQPSFSPPNNLASAQDWYFH